LALRAGTPPPLTLERLADHHQISAFSCGQAAIDEFLHAQALTEQAMGLSSVQVACERERPGVVVAYYTISPLSVNIDPRLLAALDIPAEQVPYPRVGGFLLGRLGVQTALQGQGIGNALIAIALEGLRKGLSNTGGAFLAIDAKTERNIATYRKLGFRQIGNLNRLVQRL
jgi:ribosomal protein S18 acetylase RimI-like enzyme